MRDLSDCMRVAGAAALPGYLRDHGASVRRALHRAGLVEAELRDPQAWISMERLGALYESASQELDDPNFGIRFGATIPLHAYGLLAYVILNAPTVETALRNFVRYTGYLNRAVLIDLDLRPTKAALVFSYQTTTPAHFRHYLESISSVLCSMMRALAGPDWLPSLLKFQHPQGDMSRAPENLFGAPVRFSQRTTALEFDRSIVDKVVATANRRMLPYFEQQAGAYLSEDDSADDDPLVASVRTEIVDRLCDGQPQIADVARALGMSARTLQRNLQQRDVRFKQLVANTRMQLAKDYLRRSELTITDIAFLLGYSDLSVFDRAFRTAWNTTPRAFRSSARNASD